MSILMVLAVQSLLASPSADEELPKFGYYEPRIGHGEPYPWIGIEPMALWTSFEGGLHVRNVWGFGADATVTLDYGTRAFLGFRLGYLGWNTRTDGSAGLPAEGVRIRQYRVGVFGSFPFRFLEFGIGANVGGYRFRRVGQNDTAGFFEFEAMLGARPSEFVWIGFVAMQTLTVTDFNHASDHGYANYSIGPAVEVRF
ncbi:MAG: hypothetical protein HY293_06970 [Planctomycetes bacterium]|nr:hypothetical protein [Planctomycetota bacterium]